MVIGICIIFFYLYIYGYRNEGFYNYDGSNQYNYNPYYNPYGSNSYGYNPYGYNYDGSNTYMNSPYGYGSNSYGYNPDGSNSYRYNPYKYNPYGYNSYGYNPYGSNPYEYSNKNNNNTSYGYNYDGNQTIWDKKNELENILDDIKVSHQQPLHIPQIGTYHSCDVLTSYGNNVCSSGITMENQKCKWNNTVKNSMGGQCETI